MSPKIFYIFLLFGNTVCQLEELDLNHCKLSHNGIEYHGNEYKSESGTICQSWTADSPHPVDPNLKDLDFVDGKKNVAKNHCRNPKGMFSGPWCYTTDSDISDDLCDIPLCSSKCRITIAASEYSGDMNVSQTNRKCVSWSEKHLRKYLNKKKIQTSDRLLQDDKFPDRSRKQVGKRCRNPTGDPNGLWCLVEGIVNDKEVYEKEYCDVDFCDPISNCSMATDFTTDLGYYSHFIKFRGNATSFSFSVQLWNMADFNNSTMRVALSVLPLALSGENLHHFKTGAELVIKNNGVGFVGSTGAMKEWQEVYGLLSGVMGKKFQIDWLPDKYYIAVIVPGGKTIEFEYTDVSNKKLVLQNANGTWFSYFAIRGDAALWNIPCGKDSDCEEHVTVSPICFTHRKMKKTNTDYITTFFVRSSQTVSIELRNSPGIIYPFFRIDILGAFNKTTVYVVTEEKALPKYLSSAEYENIISDWSWTEFYLSAVEERLELTWVRAAISSESVFTIQHPLIRNAKWLSICSKSVAHWAFSCVRSEITPAPTAIEPECIKTKTGINYKGTHWFSSSGQPCLPWTYAPIEKATRSYQFPGGSRIESVNYCRNPINDENGPFCFVADTFNATFLPVKKEYCDVPICQGTDCKISGIGIEYLGDLKISRSNKTCKPSEHFIQTFGEFSKYRKIPYCQNPDKNIFGPWCNTTDKLMKTDFCYLPDCSINDARTIILKTKNEYSRRYYFHADWLVEKFRFKIKMWNPNAETAVGINMFFDPTTKWFYTLIIGAENQSKVQLYYVDKAAGQYVTEERKLLREKIIPKIIPSVYWQGFWLMAPDRSIELGFEGSDSAIFSWSKEDKLPEMLYNKTKLISFHTIDDHPIGLNFPSSYVLVQRCMANWEDEFYPINAWSESNTHSGTLNISMMAINWSNDGPVVESEFPNTGIRFFEDNRKEYGLLLNINFTSIGIMDVENTVLHTLQSKHLPFRLIQYSFWTVFTITYSEKHIEVRTQFSTLLNYTFEVPRRFYYFSLTNFNEVTIWVVNNPAPRLGPPYTAGGWSDWTDVCNVPCGGGYGFQKRHCNNPKPHIWGDPCEGPVQIENECNQFECSCLNPKTIEMTQHFLGNITYNTNVTEDEDISLECEYSILMAAKLDSPGTRLAWLKDGFIIADPTKLEKLSLEETKLKIENVQLHHSGVYMCIIYPNCAASEKEFVLVKVISVVVMPESDRIIPATSQLQLDCNSPVLQYFYADLEQTWEQNDFLYVDYVTTELADVNYEYIVDIEEYHEGTWRCYVNQTKLNLLWITNQINIEVTGPPTLLTYLVNVDAPKILFHKWNPKFVVFFLYLVVAVEIGLVTYVVIWYYRVRKELLQR